jgi:hypothetical protein
MSSKAKIPAIAYLADSAQGAHRLIKPAADQDVRNSGLGLHAVRERNVRVAATHGGRTYLEPVPPPWPVHVFPSVSIWQVEGALDRARLRFWKRSGLPARFRRSSMIGRTLAANRLALATTSGTSNDPAPFPLPAAGRDQGGQGKAFIDCPVDMPNGGVPDARRNVTGSAKGE